MDFVPAAPLDRAIARIPRDRLAHLGRLVRREEVRREVFFHYREGKKRYIPLSLKPWLVTREQREELRRVCLALERAALAVFRARWSDPDLAAMLPFSPGEERVLRDSYGGSWKRSETLFTRMDLALPFERPGWRRAIRLIEMNLVGIGATYYCHSAGRVAEALLAPEIEPHLDGMTLSSEDDLLEMIVGRCGDHGAKIGCPRPVVALMETRRVLQGPFEFETVSTLLNRRGYRTIVADPIDVRVRVGELYARGVRVDLLYRDPTLAELLEMEEEGDDLRGVWWAFRKNRVVSTLVGEIDHKALVAVLSDPRFARRFDAATRRTLAGRVPWTRVIAERRTEGPDGRDVDLVAFARRNRGRLVLKPNREYGGRGVLIGSHVSAAEWERAIEEGVRTPATQIVQLRLPLRTDVIPVLERGRLAWGRRYLITGIHATERGVAVLARFSRSPVVNITRGGGVAGVLVASRSRE